MLHANKKFDCIQAPDNLIPAGEPVFLLRGSDPCTPRAISSWIMCAAAHGVPSQRLKEVRDHRARIEAYQLIFPDQLHIPGTPHPPKT